MAKEKILSELISLLGSDKVIYGAQLSDRYEHIWRMDEPLSAFGLVLPTSTEDVSGIMNICHRYEQTVVVHGGLTNLVGSTTTRDHDLVISLEKMNKIEEVDSAARTTTVQAGVILENLHDEVDTHDLLFPLNFGAKGSAQMGGILSTNAGGLRVFKYGMTRQLVLGLEAVLADGTIISSMKKIIKDNSAYDIKQLFIGSEGTLGIITKAVLKLIEKPNSRNSAIVGCQDYSDVIQLLKFIDGKLAGTLSGFELMWPNFYEAATSPPSLFGPPIPLGYNYYVLIESLGSDQQSDQEKLEMVLEEALEKNMILDAAFASNSSDLEWFWTIREDVHTVKSNITIDQHFDVSLPSPLIGEYVERVCKQLNELEAVEQVYPFGHIADGNVHFIVGKMNHDDSLREKINQIVYRPLISIGGSVSAEHGIGEDKKAYLSLCRNDEEIMLMKLLKNSLDPKRILNRGKVID